MKRLQIACLFITLFFVYSSAHGQVTISGPVCVKAGVEYQYQIDTKWESDSKSRICVTGGTVADTKQNCFSAESIASVRILWNEGTSKGSLSFTSSMGNASVEVGITEELKPGSIATVKTQLIQFNAKTPAVNCTPASGGDCSAIYIYQWQWSEDALNWQNVDGAVSQNLSSNLLLKKPLFYRRRVTEKNSNTIAYSDNATVFVEAEPDK